MAKSLRQLEFADFVRFLKDRGVVGTETCPVCGKPHQFGVEDAGEGEQASIPLFLTDDPALAEQQTSEVNWACDNCGFVRKYHTGPFIEWALRQ